MEFNRIIKLLRKERGITQKQAAEDRGRFAGPAFPLRKRSPGVRPGILWYGWQTITMSPATICWAARQSATA